MLGLAICGVVVFNSDLVRAEDINPQEIPQMDARQTLAVITRITNWIFTFLMVVVVIMVIVSGYLFVTGGGNPDQVAKARQVLIYALIGFAVAMIARGIIALVGVVIGREVTLPQWTNNPNP